MTMEDLEKMLSKLQEPQKWQSKEVESMDSLYFDYMTCFRIVNPKERGLPCPKCKSPQKHAGGQAAKGNFFKHLDICRLPVPEKHSVAVGGS
eukprot:Nk52_evm20s2506 gene=Nk52_evmTU20s2506